MEHLALEIFDLPTAEDKNPTTSKFATLEEDASITITYTSEIFASGDVWSYSFRLNVRANAHIMGSVGDLHGSRLHDVLDRRRARLWVEGIAIYLGYLKLDDEAEVDKEGNVDVTFESGQKTFDEMIADTKATEVSVGEVIIGVALNRKRTVKTTSPGYEFTLNGLAAYAEKDHRLDTVIKHPYRFNVNAAGGEACHTGYTQRWPKLVKSHGTIYKSDLTVDSQDDYTNVQTPYDDSHPFCNINICYPLKAVKADGEEVVSRGYTLRLAHGKPTTHGGDNQTRYNNAPNFYLLYFIDRLFKDLGINITENQAKDVEDLRRVFMLNYGCHYEEIENDSPYFDSSSHKTPDDKLERYGQYYIPFLDKDGVKYITNNWDSACWRMDPENNSGAVSAGKILLRDIKITLDGEDVPVGSTAECKVTDSYFWSQYGYATDFRPTLFREPEENQNGLYSAYLAYATGDNYPNVNISDIIEAMKSMFGVRLLFDGDYKTVRIILLRNVFRDMEVQEIACDVIGGDERIENKIRGFRMTYGKGKDDTSFYYKGFADLFPRVATTWKDTSDKHDYSQWLLNADYNFIKQYVSAMNKVCYVTPANGNAWGVKVDEDEEVLFPSLFEYAGFMDAEDGDCSRLEDDGKTIEEITINATPVIMNDVGISYASLFGGELKAPTPDNTVDTLGEESQGGTPFYSVASTIATFARITNNGSLSFDSGEITEDEKTFRVTGLIDAYSCEGFKIRMEDNYAISNGGTPFDEADPGLCFGIMRSSGSDAFIRYFDDPDDDENDAWEIEPGSNPISHPDTCDSYGNEWDYNGEMIVTPEDAPGVLADLFPNSDVPFNSVEKGYINETRLFNLYDAEGNLHHVLVASGYSITGVWIDGTSYQHYWSKLTLEQLQEISSTETPMIVEVDSSYERGNTLTQLCALAYGGATEPMRINGGVGSRYGRFSLKLRAEKLNPYFDPKQPESISNKRYLEIENEDLRQRGLCDAFYKEYSYWIRNARVCKRTVRMTLAQLLKIDKTKRVKIGDITGFVRKVQYTVSKKSGLGMVTFEIMYI